MVVREMRVGAIFEESQVHAARELLRPLRLQVVLRLSGPRGKATESGLGGGDIRTPTAVAECGRGIRRQRLVRPGLLARLAVGKARLAEAHKAQRPPEEFEHAVRVVQILRELPRRTRLAEPGPAVVLPDGRESVAPHSRAQLQLGPG